MLARLPAGAAMSEPCRHEREFAGTQADTLTSFVRTTGRLVKVTAERDAAKAALATILALCEDAEDRRDWLAVHAIRAAIEATKPKGKP